MDATGKIRDCKVTPMLMGRRLGEISSPASRDSVFRSLRNLH